MFIDDAHILRASSSTVWACTSKRPAIARISCGSVIKRVAMLPSPYRSSLRAEVLTTEINGGVAALWTDYDLPVNCSPQTGDMYPLLLHITGPISDDNLFGHDDRLGPVPRAGAVGAGALGSRRSARHAGHRADRL